MLSTRIVLFVLALSPGLAACTASTAGQWQKSGADEPTIARDTSECRNSADREATRRYPYGFSSPSFGAAGMVMSQQRDETNRSNAEAALFNSCMQDRGYRRGPVPDK
jgi:hypothetical protein